MLRMKLKYIYKKSNEPLVNKGEKLTRIFRDKLRLYVKEGLKC
jgi:hypothetical protein